MTSSRYAFQKTLGAGAMGRVDLVFDHERGELVAQKRIARITPRALLRFKLEYRAIVRLAHPGLVRLYDLGHDDDGPFFTMEVVEGDDLATACRRNPRLLLRAVAGILSALAYLHEQGIAHCDLKPSNLLVAPGGNAKILDFGILAQIGHDASSADALPGVSGTPSYMAPELFRGERATVASDLYALGVVLRELARDLEMPTAARPLLEALASDDPLARPSLRELAVAFGGAADDARSSDRDGPSALPRSRFFGRDAEIERLLDSLARAYDGGFAAFGLAGPTGIGKSALVAEVARIAQRGGALVLRGHAHVRERVAFNGIDDAVDALAKHLASSASITTELREIVVAASSLFPTLAVAVAASDDAPPTLPPPLHTARAGAFAAFVALLTHVADRAGALLLVVDDLQWMDADAAALLAAIARQAPPRVFLLTTRRSDLSLESPHTAQLTDAGLVEAPLGDLDTASLRALVVASFHGRGALHGTEVEVARVVALANGRPLLAELGARAALDSVEIDGTSPGLLEATAALARRITRLEPLERHVVTTLVAADGWLDAQALAACVGEARGAVDDALTVLERRGLVRLGADARDGRDADLVHDVVRTAVLESLPREALRSAHGKLFDALVARAETPPLRLVGHLLEAGRERDAWERAAVAADRAFDTYAYGLAAELFAVALRDPSADRPAFLGRRARAFDLAGRYREAAEAFATLARDLEARGVPAADVRLDEARALLAAGDAEAGRAKIEALLAARGEPLGGVVGVLTDARAAVRFLRGPARDPRGVARAANAAEVAARLDDAERDERTAMLVTYIDPLRGLAYMQRARERFVVRGASASAAMCDYLFAYWALFGRAKGGSVPLARAYEAAALRRVAGVAQLPPRVASMPSFLAGVIAQRAGAGSAAAAAFEEALAMLEACGASGTFEHLLVLTHRVALPLARGNVVEARTLMKRFRQAAGERLDSALRCFVSTYEDRLALLEGRFDDARARAWATLQAWPDVGTYQRGYLAAAFAGLAVYVGDAAEERARLAFALRRDARFRFLDNMYLGRFAAAFALLDARAMRAGDRTVRRADVERWAKRALAAPPIASAGALRALAYVDEIEGRAASRIDARLREAESFAAAHDQPFDVAIARHQRGLRIGGAEGARLRDAARAGVAALGVSERLLDEHAC